MPLSQRLVLFPQLLKLLFRELKLFLDVFELRLHFRKLFLALIELLSRFFRLRRLLFLFLLGLCQVNLQLVDPLTLNVQLVAVPLQYLVLTLHLLEVVLLLDVLFAEL